MWATISRPNEFISITLAPDSCVEYSVSVKDEKTRIWRLVKYLRLSVGCSGENRGLRADDDLVHAKVPAVTGEREI